MNKFVKQSFDTFRLPSGRLLWVKCVFALMAVVAAGSIAIAYYAHLSAVPSQASIVSDGRTTHPASIMVDPSGVENQIVAFASGVTNGSQFNHPGIYVNQAQLDFVKTQLAENAAPWTAGFAKIPSRYANPAYVPAPVVTTDCTANYTGCQKAVDDAIAAYTQALMYYYSNAPDRAKHAQAAIRIINAWSSTLKFSKGTQAQLMLAWSGEVFPRAAEIIRYMYTPAAGETALNIPAFTTMLQNVYLPQFDPTMPASTSSAGNWQLAMADAMINIGVFTDNRSTFDQGVAIWRSRVPAYIYLASDGAAPAPPPGGRYDDPAALKCLWYGSPSATTTCTLPPNFQYIEGMTQETCRDMSHVVMGMSSMVYAAETARLQGLDLYSEQQPRIVAGLEYSARFDDQFLSTGVWPTEPCNGQPTAGNGTGGVGYLFGWEVAYNHYANRTGLAMPYTKLMVNRVRPTGGINATAWETLTHAAKDVPVGCVAPDTRLGTVSVDITVPTDGTYRLWTRVNPGQTGNSVYNLQVDYGCSIAVGGDAPASQWSWVDYQNADATNKVNLTLTAGKHTLTLNGHSPDLAVSRLIVAANPSCVPVGSGDNCLDDTAPSAPSLLQSSNVTPTSVTLEWSGASDDTLLERYEIYRDGQLVATTPSSITGYIDDTLNAQTTYNYMIKAIDVGANSSPASDTLPVQTSAIPGVAVLTTAITAPTTDTTIRGMITLVASTSDNSLVSDLEFVLDGNVIGATTTSPYELEWDSTSVADGTYNLQARVYDIEGAITNSNDVLVNIDNIDSTPPTAPSDLSAVATSPTEVTLAWTAADDDIGVTGYDIIRDGILVASLEATDLSYNDTDLVASTAYVYAVLARDQAGNTSALATKSITTLPPPDITAPTAPSNLSATITSPTAVSLTWAAASDNIGVTGYSIARDGVIIATVGTVLSYSDVNLSESTTYSYVVYASDEAGNVSVASTASSVTTPDTTPPTIPQGLALTTQTGTSLTFNWQAATDAIGVTGYVVLRNDVVIANTTDVNYTDQSLSPATTYTYTIAARDGAGNVSNASQPASFTTLDTVAPTAPASLSAIATSSSQINVIWQAATDNVGVVKYLLSRNQTPIAELTGLTYNDTTLSAGTSYTYSVIAVDAAGNNGPAIAFTVSTLPATVPAAAGFAAQYFNNKTLSGAPITRIDSTVNFNWAKAAPMSGITTDNFSVRWTGKLTPTVSGKYTLYTETDDGTRLWVNNSLVINGWGGPGSRSASYTFTAGQSYNIKLEYVEQAGSAFARLLWSGPGIAKAIIPSDRVSSQSNGLNATYFANATLSGTPTFMRPDANVNFSWGTAAPDSRLGVNNFSVRWIGKLLPTTSGVHTLYTESDDGVRLWVNNQLLIDNWTNHAVTTNSATINLTSGGQYDIRMEYYDMSGSATAKLSWGYGLTTKTIIPSTALRDR